MPAPGVALNDIFQLQIQGNVVSTNTLTVLNYRVSALGGAVQYITFTNALLSAIPGGALEGAYRSATPTNFTIEQYRLQRVYPTRDVGLFLPSGLAGAWSGASCQQPGTASVFWRTSDRAGRSQRSVTHVPALPSDAASANALTTAFKAVLQSLGNACLTPITFTLLGFNYTLQPIIFHKKTLPTPTYDDVRAATINLTPRTERKRVAGYGR